MFAHTLVLKYVVNYINKRFQEFSIEVIRDSQEYRRSEGFLTNDSLSLSIMEQNGIGIIATGDLDFNRIEKIEVWSPMDV